MMEDKAEMSKKFLSGWMLVCSLGLIGIVYGVSRLLKSTPSLAIEVGIYNDWAIPWLSPGKPQELMFEGGAWIALFLYYLVFYLAVARTSSESFLETLWNGKTHLGRSVVIACGLLLIGFNGLVFGWFRGKNNHVLSITSLVLTVSWIATVIIPFFAPSQIRRRVTFRPVRFTMTREVLIEKINQWAHSRRLTRIMVSVLCLICLHFIFVFSPFIWGELKLINEYLDIPGYTYVNGNLVQSTNYINTHAIGGLNKYDPFRDLGATPMPRDGTYVRLPKNSLLASFLEDHATDYYYNDGLQALVVNRAMTVDEHMLLSYIYREDEYRDQVSWLYDASSAAQRLWDRTPSPEEWEFLEKNKFEILHQILNRWVIHHHNFVLGPINEYVKGKPLKEINAQYGPLNVVLMANLLESLGGITYDRYFRVWYSFWLVYFAVFVLCALLLLGDVFYTMLVCVLAFGYIMTINFQFLSLGPGLNPLRHFFDVPVMAAFWMFLKRQHIGYLVIAMICALLGMLNNFQFGLALAAALFGALAIMILINRGMFSIRGIINISSCTVLILVIPAVALYVNGLVHNSMLSYYLSGFAGPPFSIDRLALTMMIMSAGYAFLSHVGNAYGNLKYLALLLMFYSQGLFLYYTWGNTQPHILNIAPLLVLCAVLYLKLVFERTSFKEYQKPLLLVLIVASFGFVYIPGCFAYYSSKRTFDENFIDHKAFKWNLEKGTFTSTMDPKPFEDSISLVKEFSGANSAIYIISKYDNYIPFLADRYSAMPFFDVQWFVITTKESDLCIERIKSEKPRYLFVDTDIERNLNGDIIRGIVSKEANFNKGIGPESRLRVVRLGVLQRIFHAIKDDYIPVKKGILLTAYQRKA